MEYDWKPSFWEVARSRSWTEHFMMYLGTFGVVIWVIFNPQTWIEWFFVVLLDIAASVGYWTLMINFQRESIQEMNSSLKQQQLQLERLERELNQMVNNDNAENENSFRDDNTNDGAIQP